MPELWNLIAQYPILVSIVKNLTTREFLNVASISKKYRKLLITDCNEVSLRNIKGQTRCDGEGCADKFDFCSHCKCKTCENCRVTLNDVGREQHVYPGDMSDMRPFGVWRCRDCHSMDITDDCACTPERRWLLPYICRRCFDGDLSRTAKTREREHMARRDRIGLSLEDPLWFTESVADPWDPDETEADCDRCGRLFILNSMHYMCPFCDGLHKNVEEYWNLQEYYPHCHT